MRLARLNSDQDFKVLTRTKIVSSFFVNKPGMRLARCTQKLIGGDYGRLQGRPESCLSKPRYRHNRTDRTEANRSRSAAVLHSSTGRNQFVGPGSSFKCQRGRLASSDYISRMRYAL